MIKSPCIKHCNLNTNGVCLGCFRTTQEISNWRNMNEEEKTEVCSKIRLRASSVQQMRDKGVSDDGQT
jgi:predicted Fe-S protein YdhL (DUF1289 family)